MIMVMIMMMIMMTTLREEDFLAEMILESERCRLLELTKWVCNAMNNSFFSAHACVVHSARRK
ncbi:hypothetical protein HanXRQr2_Chr07g0295391 [Helianthus annuus]|uniref:Secreted protein n=1 Tax=Helianthus annuus TaxID=4232 RepID=A0A9K3NG82_HELAN|nr:hypothetical protein HanXRQr2_Chr07g0295391 [Helianthus annuus]KAJ0904758.1 hypothetical protein HanPSC8_Chr07g0285971 [Helianthus annuus]